MTTPPCVRLLENLASKLPGGVLSESHCFAPFTWLLLCPTLSRSASDDSPAAASYPLASPGKLPGRPLLPLVEVLNPDRLAISEGFSSLTVLRFSGGDPDPDVSPCSGCCCTACTARRMAELSVLVPVDSESTCPLLGTESLRAESSHDRPREACASRTACRPVSRAFTSPSGGLAVLSGVGSSSAQGLARDGRLGLRFPGAVARGGLCAPRPRCALGPTAPAESGGGSSTSTDAAPVGCC